MNISVIAATVSKGKGPASVSVYSSIGDNMIDGCSHWWLPLVLYVVWYSTEGRDEEEETMPFDLFVWFSVPCPWPMLRSCLWANGWYNHQAALAEDMFVDLRVSVFQTFNSVFVSTCLAQCTTTHAQYLHKLHFFVFVFIVLGTRKWEMLKCRCFMNATGQDKKQWIVTVSWASRFPLPAPC